MGELRINARNELRHAFSIAVRNATPGLNVGPSGTTEWS